MFEPDNVAQMTAAFDIPPDNDDTGLNLVLGTLLKQFYPDIYNNKWQPANSNYTFLYENIKYYSYRPFANLSTTAPPTNVSDKIDTRTFYVLQGFLNETMANAAAEGVDPSLILVTTWILNQYEEKSKLVEMPFHTNNVDVTVNANALLGLNSLLQSLDQQAADELFDEEVRQIMVNTTSLISWAIRSNIVNIRGDLALTYYPSIYCFYWFVARNAFFLNNNEGSLKYAEQEQSRNKLN
jgi:hypothetical protein